MRLAEQEEDDRKKVDDEDRAFRPLPAFPDDSPLAGKRWVAKYNQVSVLPLEVLDLCWTNKDGNCQWNEAAEVLARLAPSQKLRLEKMLDSFNQKAAWQLIASRLPGVENQYDSSADAQQRGLVKFAVRRVGRMAHAFAHAISEGFGRNVARHSFEHDMSAGS